MTEETKQKAPREVPALIIKFDQLEKTIKDIPHPSGNKILVAALETIKKKAAAFETDRADFSHRDTHEALLELEVFIKTERAKIKGEDSRSKRLADAVVTHLNEACETVRKALTLPAVEPISEPEPLWQRDRLRFNQQLLLSDSLGKKFTDALKEVADPLCQDSCRLC